MTLGIATAVRNSMLDAIAAAIDAGAAGLLRIYDGTRPATGGSATNLLAQLTFTDPCAPAAALGVLTFSAITADSAADATGTATWFRMVTSAAGFVLDGSVTASGGGGDYQLNTTAIVTNAQVSCTSATITAGNA